MVLGQHFCILAYSCTL